VRKVLPWKSQSTTWPVYGGEKMSGEPEDFDVEGAVNDYRSITDNLEAAKRRCE
jgi:hypothetical protein